MSGPAVPQYFAVTPSSSNQPAPIMALMATGNPGTCLIESTDGSTITIYLPLAQWVQFPYAIVMVNTGGTATGIVAASWGAPNRGPAV